DINIHRRMEGKKEVFKPIRARTVIYTLMIVAIGGAMLYKLATRSLLDLNVLHDRNPLAVRLSDGSIRNGYTIRFLNKRGFDRVVTVDVDGPPNAVIHVVGTDSITPDRPMIILGRDTTTELRVLVDASFTQDEVASMPVTFHVTDIGLGEVASTKDVFVAP
ncbi:FixG Ig-like domain-containing protein, partial [Rhodopseudomonas sp. B29]|uniref:FixG Ig-like domain-containing protein n=1 Tax=Rhodopseudomonas sp. B29 TaxID=95607 RepID=UPI0024C06902